MNTLYYKSLTYYFKRDTDIDAIFSGLQMWRYRRAFRNLWKDFSLKKKCHFLCFIYTPETTQNVGFCVQIFQDHLTRLTALRSMHELLIRIFEDSSKYFFISPRTTRTHVRGWLGRRSRLVKVDFAFSLVKSEVQVAL